MGMRMPAPNPSQVRKVAPTWHGRTAAAGRPGSAPRGARPRGRRAPPITWSMPIASPHAIGPRGWLRPSSSRCRRRSAEPTPSPIANHASFTSWQTIRPSTSPGASSTHSAMEAEPREEAPRPPPPRTAASPAAARQLHEPSRAAAAGGSPTAPGSPRAARLPAAHSTTSGAPPGELRRRASARVDHQLRRAALAQLVAGRPRALAQAVGERAVAEDRDQRAVAAAAAAAARGRRGGRSRRRRSRSSRARSCGRAARRRPCAPGSGSAASAARRTTAR